MTEVARVRLDARRPAPHSLREGRASCRTRPTIARVPAAAPIPSGPPPPRRRPPPAAPVTERPPRQQRYAPGYARHGSGHALAAIILVPLVLVTFVLLILALRGYVSEGGSENELPADPLPSVSAAPDG